MPTLSEMYQRELAYYRELLGEFAVKYPEVAHMVDGREADAAVERLLQGASLLTGYLRSRVEDPFSEVIQPLCERVWPQHLRPTPPLVVLRAKPEGRGARQVLRLPRGSRVGLALSNPQAGRRELDFLTCESLEVPPVVLDEVAVERPGPADVRLRLHFVFHGAPSFQGAGLKRLRIHFVGQPAVRFALYLLLAQGRHRVVVEDSSGSSCLAIEPAQIRPIGFSSSEALLDGWPALRPGFRLLFEYFDLQSKFLGVEIEGFESAPKDMPGDSFALVFLLGAQPDLPVLGVEDFELGRVNAVNLSGPTRLSLGSATAGAEQVLDDGMRQAFRIEAVASQFGGKLASVPEATTTTRVHGANPINYAIAWSDDVGGGVSPRLSLVDGEGIPAAGQRTCDVWGQLWDRALAAQACVPGALNPSTRGGPFELEIVGGPVPPRALTVARLQLLWAAMAELTQHPNDLCSVNGLTQLVREARSGREGVGREPEILDVRSRLGARVYRRTVVPLRDVEIDLAERGFDGPGQLFLFGRVLSELFRRRGDTPTFWAVGVRGLPSGVSYRFGPQ